MASIEIFDLLHTDNAFWFLLIMRSFASTWMLGGYNIGLKIERNTLFLFLLQLTKILTQTFKTMSTGF